MDELLYVLTQYFVSCVHVCFSFSLLLIFTLLAASISYFLSAPLNFHVFLPTKFISFVFNNSLQLFPVSVNIKNDVEKDMTLLFFSFQKPGQPCGFLPNKTFSCIWVARPVDRVILHRYACGVDRQSGGQSVGVRSRDYQIFLDGKITTFP